MKLKFILTILILVLLSQYTRADLIVTTVDSEPKVIEPGDTATLMITLKNLNDDDVENVRVKLDLTNVPFAPTKSGLEGYIKEIGEDKERSVYFDIMTLSDAKTGTYKIPINIESNNTQTKGDVIALKVWSKPIVEVLLDSSEIIEAGQTGTIMVKIVNKGLTDVTFLNVRLLRSNSYEILSSDNVYIGNLDSDDYETVEFKLYIKENQDKTNKKLETLPVYVEYKDLDNKLYTTTIPLFLNLYTSSEARQYGLVKSTRLWYALPILIIVYLIYRWRARKRRDAS